MFVTKNGIVIKELNIDHYRGVRNLSISNLSRVNVFVGANNCGKTSILEAIKIMSDPTNIGQLVAVAFHRSNPTTEKRKKELVDYVLSTFKQVKDDSDDSKGGYYSIKMSANTDAHLYEYEAGGNLGEIIDYSGERKKALDIAVRISTDNKNSYFTQKLVNDSDNAYEAKNTPLYNALYIPSNVNLYRSSVLFLSDFIKQGGKADILHILQSFDAKIEDVSVVGEDIYVYNSASGSMPLFTYGAGLQKAVLLASALAFCQNGIILIDEIDNAIHVSAFEEVLTWFIDACIKYNVQAFISTHSLEALDAIVSAAQKHHSGEDFLRIVTLRKDLKNHVTRYKLRTGEEACLDREMFRVELRV